MGNKTTASLRCLASGIKDSIISKRQNKHSPIRIFVIDPLFVNESLLLPYDKKDNSTFYNIYSI